MNVLQDESREFVSSQMVRLELLPKPKFGKQVREVAFYEAHFAVCAAIEPLSEALGLEAERLAARYGLSGPDALQIAAALRHGVEEFWTSEQLGKPMFRVKDLAVRSLHSVAVSQ